MSNQQVQIRRDTQSNLSAATPTAGEFGYATDVPYVVIGDGSTAGGLGVAGLKKKGGDIASASPLVIDTDGEYFDVTGTTGFSAMTVAAGREFMLQFDGALTMTHGSALRLPGASNITTAAGDRGIFYSTGANDVECLAFIRASTANALSDLGLGPASNPTFTSLFLNEQSAAASDVAGDGQFWVRDDTPNTPMFTDDAGTDHQLARVTDAIITDDQITFFIDGGGSAITTGVKGYIPVDFACTITQVTLLADQSATITIDIWKDSYANYPPTDADSITASAVPGTSAANKDQDATLTGWTTGISAGDVLGFNVDANDNATFASITLKVTRS